MGKRDVIIPDDAPSLGAVVSIDLGLELASTTTPNVCGWMVRDNLGLSAL